MKKLLKYTMAVALPFIAFSPAHASGGSSGVIVPDSIHSEGGKIYIHGNFPNPDQCATSTMVVLTPTDDEEKRTMVSIALTSIASGKPISMWLLNCTAVPWFPSAPQAVSMSIQK